MASEGAMECTIIEGLLTERWTADEAVPLVRHQERRCWRCSMSVRWCNEWWWDGPAMSVSRHRDVGDVRCRFDGATSWWWDGPAVSVSGHRKILRHKSKSHDQEDTFFPLDKTTYSLFSKSLSMGSSTCYHTILAGKSDFPSELDADRAHNISCPRVRWTYLLVVVSGTPVGLNLSILKLNLNTPLEREPSN